jgi:predicted transcriptional regulator
MSDNNEELIALTASIVSAYVKRNNLPTADLPRLIASTHVALASLAGPPSPVAAESLIPAVPIRRSVTPNAVIRLEDGRASNP